MGGICPGRFFVPVWSASDGETGFLPRLRDLSAFFRGYDTGIEANGNGTASHHPIYPAPPRASRKERMQ